MGVMTAQQVLPMTMVSGVVRVGAAADLLEDSGGGEVFIHGNLTYAWSGDDQALRRLTAVQLVEMQVAKVGDVADAFGVDTATLWRWRREFAGAGVGGLAADKRGPKGASKLTASVIADIRARRQAGASLRAVAAATGVSTGSVRRALTPHARDLDEPDASGAFTDAVGDRRSDEGDVAPVGDTRVRGRVADLPVLAVPAARTTDRVAARWHGIECAGPVFTPAAQVPLAGLFLALPALEATGLLTCAKEVYTRLPAGFYGLDTMLVEGVLRALAGEPRAEGATRIDPTDLGRVLGLDRAPEVKTIRRKIAQLAQAGAAGKLQAAIAHHHLSRGDADVAGAGLVLYVDGHVRAYQGTKRIGKTHLSRLRFPAPATVETWVAGGDGGPVLVVMSEPGTSLAGELARLLPELRTAVGDDRRVLVGFDRGAQLGQQPGQLTGQGRPGFGHHHQDRSAVTTGHPGLHGRRGGEPQPRQLRLADPLGAHGPRLPGQGPQHALDEHRVQAVEPGRQAGVNLFRAGQQAGGLQRGQRQEQPRQPDLGRGGEHRSGALDPVPPGRHPIGGARGRDGEHRQIRHPPQNLSVATLGVASVAGVELARCRGQRSAHAPGGDPRRGGDRPQRRTRLPASADVGDHACRQLRGALGAPLVRHEAAHTGPGELAAPTPQRGRVDTERVGDIADAFG